MTVALVNPPARAASDPGNHQPVRHQGLAGRGLHGPDRHHERRLPRRRGAGSGRQGRPRQPDVGPARRGRRRPRFARLPGEARGSQHRPLLRRRLRRLLRQPAHALASTRTRRSSSSAWRSTSRASTPSRSRASAARCIAESAAGGIQSERDRRRASGRRRCSATIPTAARRGHASRASRRSPPTT